MKALLSLKNNFTGLSNAPIPKKDLSSNSMTQTHYAPSSLDVSRLQMARPGQYRLRGTEEVVEDPDYTMMLKLYPEG